MNNKRKIYIFSLIGLIVIFAGVSIFVVSNKGKNVITSNEEPII